MTRFLMRAVRVGVVVSCVLGARDVSAGSHLWRINEVFSNTDGTVQFIELHEILNAQREWFLTHCWFESADTGNVFRFPDDLTEPTGLKYLLLATEAFAAIPGAPTPDYIIPDGFFSIDGDTLWYGRTRNYDNFVFEPGELPTDGINSIQITEYAPNNVLPDEFETGVNSPTNFAGDTGTIEVIPPGPTFVRGDCNDDSAVNISDAGFLLLALFGKGIPPTCDDTCDSNDDGFFDISDAVNLLLTLFSHTVPLPGPHSCGEDPTTDGLDCASFSGC